MGRSHGGQSKSGQGEDTPTQTGTDVRLLRSTNSPGVFTVLLPFGLARAALAGRHVCRSLALAAREPRRLLSPAACADIYPRRS